VINLYIITYTYSIAMYMHTYYAVWQAILWVAKTHKFWEYKLNLICEIYLYWMLHMFIMNAVCIKEVSYFKQTHIHALHYHLCGMHKYSPILHMHIFYIAMYLCTYIHIHICTALQVNYAMWSYNYDKH